MKELFNIDNFLSKWAAGQLSDSEKEAFEKTEDYKYFQAILDGTNLLEIPLIHGDDLYEGIRKKIENDKKVRPMIPKWVYGVAASVALLISYFFFFPDAQYYSTDYGAHLLVTLPDNSEVILNAKSSLEYSKKDWKNDKRTVVLHGEGFFKVQPGSDFKVKVDKGEVSVLGTQFAVNSIDNSAEVICFEGQVSVDFQGLSQLIKQGQAIRYINGAFESWKIQTNEPGWLTGESNFNNAPIHQVIQALANQYKLEIIRDEIDSKLRFTGSFTHRNIDVALKTVFDSMEIKFTFTDDKTLYLTKK